MPSLHDYQRRGVRHTPQDNFHQVRRALKNATAAPSYATLPVSVSNISNSSQPAPASATVNSTSSIAVPASAEGNQGQSKAEQNTHRADRVGWIGGVIISIATLAALVAWAVRVQRKHQKKIQARNHATLWGDGLDDKDDPEKSTSKPKKAPGAATFLTCVRASSPLSQEESEQIASEKGAKCPKSKLIGSHILKSLTPKPGIDMKKAFQVGDEKKQPLDTIQMEMSHRARQINASPPVPPLAAHARKESARSEENLASSGYIPFSEPSASSSPVRDEERQMPLAYPLQTYGHLDTTENRSHSKKKQGRGMSC